MSRFGEELGHRIRGARKAAHLLQCDLASMVNLSKASISAYERATKTPSVETVALIASACGVGIGELVPKVELIPTVDERQTSIYDYLEYEK